MYHATARGNGPPRTFRDERDQQGLLEGLEAMVDKLGLAILNLVCMLNRIQGE